MRILLIVVASVMLSGCYTVVQPALGTPIPEQPVRASFAKTWDAVIDYFAEKNITIETIERASGIVVAAPGRIGSEEFGTKLADCGSYANMRFAPSRVAYNVRVKGDSSRSSIRVNARFITAEPRIVYDCASRGTLEETIVQTVKARAER